MSEESIHEGITAEECVARLIAASEADMKNGRPRYVTKDLLERARKALDELGILPLRG